MKSVNASTVSPVSGALPTSASSMSTSIGLNGSSNVLHELDAASPSTGLKPLVQSSTPPSPSCMGWGVPALVPARLAFTAPATLAGADGYFPGLARALNMARRYAPRVQGRGISRTLYSKSLRAAGPASCPTHSSLPVPGAHMLTSPPQAELHRQLHSGLAEGLPVESREARAGILCLDS